MDQKRSHILCITIISAIMIAAFAGCISTSTLPGTLQPASTMVALPSITVSTPTLRASRAPSPTPIPPVPTLPFDQELLLAEGLQSKDCVLPCYLGITPGKTSLTGAKAILESFGGLTDTPYTRPDGAKEFHYTLWVGDSAFPVDTPEPNGDMVKIGHEISLITDNDIVQIMEVYITVTKSKEKFQKYWSRYSPREIFLQAGQPDQIYIDTGIETTNNAAYWGFNFLFVYEKSGARFEFLGVKDGDLICTQQFGGRFASISLVLYDPFSQLSIYGVPPSDREVWAPIDEVLKTNKSEFYNKVLSDLTACFDPKEPAP